MNIEGLVIGEGVFQIPECRKYAKKVHRKGWRKRRGIYLDELQTLVDKVNKDLEAARRRVEKDGQEVSNPHQTELDRITDTVLMMVSVMFHEENEL